MYIRKRKKYNFGGPYKRPQNSLVEPPVLLDDDIIYFSDNPYEPGVNKDILDSEYKNFLSGEREFKRKTGMSPQEYYNEYPDENTFYKKTFDPKNAFGKVLMEYGGKIKYSDGGSLPEDDNKKRKPIYVNDPNDPRLQMYNDSLDLYKLSNIQFKNFYSGYPKSTQNVVDSLENIINSKPYFKFDETSYKKDAAKGFKNIKKWEEYIYDDNKFSNYERSEKDKTTADRIYDTEIAPLFKENDFITLKNGVERKYDSAYKGVTDKGNYTDFYPDGTVKGYYEGKLNYISSDKIKPIRKDYYSKGKIEKSSSINTSSLSTEKINDNPIVIKEKSNKNYQNWWNPSESFDVYKKPVQPVIYKKEKIEDKKEIPKESFNELPMIPTPDLSTIIKPELRTNPKQKAFVQQIQATPYRPMNYQINLGNKTGWKDVSETDLDLYDLEYPDGTPFKKSEFKFGGRIKYPDGGRIYANKQGVIMGPVENPDGTYTLPQNQRGEPVVNLPEVEITPDSSRPTYASPGRYGTDLVKGVTEPVLDFLFPNQEYTPTINERTGLPYEASGRADATELPFEIGSGALKKFLTKGSRKFLPSNLNPKNLKSESAENWMNEWYKHPDFIRRYNPTGQYNSSSMQSGILEDLNDYKPKNYIDILKDKGLAEYLKASASSSGLSWGKPESIYVNRTSFAPFNKKGLESVKAHELTHLIENNGYLLSRADEKALLKPFGIFDKKEIPKNPGFLKRATGDVPEYFLDPTEIHARVNQARFDLGLTPKDKFTEEMFDKISKDKKWYGMGKYVKDKSAMIDLMNKFWAVPAAIGVGAASQLEENNNTQEFKYGGNINNTMKKKKKYFTGGNITKPLSDLKNPFENSLQDLIINGNKIEYKVGGKILKQVAAGAYGVAEGILDTVTMGATDQLTDKGFEALTKAGNKNIDLSNPDDVKFLKNQQKVKGYTNTAGAVGAGIYTGNVQGAIKQGTKGLNTAFQATDGLSDDFKQVSQGVTGIAGVASGFAGGLNSDSFNADAIAGNGAAGFGKQVGKFSPLGDQAMGMIGGNQQPLWQQGDVMQEIANNKSKFNQSNYSQGSLTYAQGGEIVDIEGGGTHEENKYGGVPVGPNALLEQDEKLVDGDFVLSNRLGDENGTFAEQLTKEENRGSKMRDNKTDKFSKWRIKNKKDKLVALNQAALEDINSIFEADTFNDIAAYGGKMKYPNGGKVRHNLLGHRITEEETVDEWGDEWKTKEKYKYRNGFIRDKTWVNGKLNYNNTRFGEPSLRNPDKPILNTDETEFNNQPKNYEYGGKMKKKYFNGGDIFNTNNLMTAAQIAPDVRNLFVKEPPVPQSNMLSLERFNPARAINEVQRNNREATSVGVEKMRQQSGNQGQFLSNISAFVPKMSKQAGEQVSAITGAYDDKNVGLSNQEFLTNLGLQDANNLRKFDQKINKMYRKDTALKGIANKTALGYRDEQSRKMEKMKMFMGAMGKENVDPETITKWMENYPEWLEEMDKYLQ